MKCRDCGKVFDQTDYPEEERSILEEMVICEMELCRDCLMERVRKAGINLEKLEKIASERYKKFKKCLVCGRNLWVTKNGIKFCKNCEILYRKLDLVEVEIDEEVCSLLPDYEEVCDDLCPIEPEDCPSATIECSIHELSEEEIETAKPIE